MAVYEDRLLNSSYWTRLVFDGGWNNRSKGYDYTAKGCVGVFIKKLSHVGIKNKYCYICFRAVKKVKKPLTVMYAS